MLAILSLLAMVACHPGVIREKGDSMQLLNFIDTVVRLEPLDHASFGRLIEKQGALSRSNEYYETFSFDGFAVGDGVAANAVELRQPRPGSGATGGTLLTMDVGGPCVKLDVLQQHFGKLTLFQVPRGRNANEKTVYSIRSGAREVRFGFAEAAAGCMTGLTIETFPA